MSDYGSLVESTNADSWYGVQDARQRKIIQDRLAQRARRKRLSELKKPRPGKVTRPEHHYPQLLPRVHPEDQKLDSAESDNGDAMLQERDDLSTTRDENCLILKENGFQSHANYDCLALINLDSLITQRWRRGESGEDMEIKLEGISIHSSLGSDYFPSKLDLHPSRLPLLQSQTNLQEGTELPKLTPDHIYLSVPHIAISMALQTNGLILGIVCGKHRPSRLILPANVDVPPSLRPTTLQATAIHQQYIDQFPFPRFRDNLIALCGILDEAQFLRDLLESPEETLTFKRGSPSWDPRSWRMPASPFKERWGYLFANPSATRSF